MTFAELPDDVPHEAFQTLVESFQEAARKNGLYLEGAALNVDQRGEEEDGTRRHLLVTHFRLGEHAFSKTVQDPEGDKFDHEFRKIANGTTEDAVDEIKRKYQRPTDSPPPPEVEDGQDT